MTEQTITQFVSDWFKAMEPMPENIDWFLGRVSESLELVMPEGAFEGHAGFETWYRGAARTFEAGWVHDVQQLNVGEAVDGVYPVEMELTLIATLIAPEGKPAKQLKLPLTESWAVSVADSGDVTIHSYRVAMKR
ncbi:MAG: hypothetical protein K6L60_11895 [Oceanobacter sp.]